MATSGAFDSGSFSPVLRCGGVPYTKYGCADAPRPDEKSHAVRGALRLRAKYLPRSTQCRASSQRKISRCSRRTMTRKKGVEEYARQAAQGKGAAPPLAGREYRPRGRHTAAGGCPHLRGLRRQLLQQRPLHPAGQGVLRRGLLQHLCHDRLQGVLPQCHAVRRHL